MIIYHHILRSECSGPFMLIFCMQCRGLIFIDAMPSIFHVSFIQCVSFFIDIVYISSY